MNQPRLQRLYEIVARANGEILSHWITTSCIEAMSHAHKLAETRRDFYDDDPRLTIGLFSSVVHCSDMPEIQTIK
jgi:hypothetical protein